MAPTQLSVVHLVAPAPFGGLESVVVNLAAGQTRAGDKVCVAAVLSDDQGEDHPFVNAARARGVEVVVLHVAVRDYLKERRETAALLAARGAQILHTHGYRPDVVDAPVARKMGVGAVSTVHGYTGGGGFKGRLYEWLQTRSYTMSDAVIAVSEMLRGELVAAGVPPEQVHRVPNAWASFGSSASRADSRRVLGIATQGAVVGWVGRLSREKAPDVALRVTATMGHSSATLSMVGTGAMDEELNALAGSLGVGDRVRLHGYVKDVARYLPAFDALLITSWTEGTPIVLLEAMAAGVPVVTTAVGGIPDVVGKGEAWLAPAGDVAALAAGLDEVLAHPVAAAGRAAAARRRLTTDFAVGPWVERHREIYRAVVARLRRVT